MCFTERGMCSPGELIFRFKVFDEFGVGFSSVVFFVFHSVVSTPV